MRALCCYKLRHWTLDLERVNLSGEDTVTDRHGDLGRAGTADEGVYQLGGCVGVFVGGFLVSKTHVYLRTSVWAHANPSKKGLIGLGQTRLPERAVATFGLDLLVCRGRRRWQASCAGHMGRCQQIGATTRYYWHQTPHRRLKKRPFLHFQCSFVLPFSHCRFHLNFGNGKLISK